jgi:hypothetical protein
MTRLRMSRAARHGLAALALGLMAALPAHAQDLPSGPVSFADGRITLGTNISFSTTAQDDNEGAWFNYTDYEHNTLRMTRFGVTADIRLLDRVSFLAEVRTENGDAVRPYALFVRIRPLKDLPLDIQAGRIPPTFGAFSRRSYADGNPLIGYPLAYQYLTSLRADAIPADTDELLRMRARGWRPSYGLGSQLVAPGMPLITAFRWDTGVQVRAGPDRLVVSAAVTNGTLSDPHTRDNNGGKQLSGRVQWRPTTGLAIGGSAARGRYLSDALRTSTSLTGPDRATQRALGVDAEYSRDHWLMRGEAVWNQWQVPTLAPSVNAASVFVEGTYKILPGFFAAGRIDRLSFGRVTTPTQSRAWDAPVTRAETGVGFYVRRNLLAKTTYQHNWRAGGVVRSRGLVAVQLQFWL